MTTLREKQIRFLSFLSYIFIILSIFNSLAMLLFFGVTFFSLFGFFIALLFYFTLSLNRNGYHFLAKMIILSIFNFAIVNISSTQGSGSGSILLYFPLVSLYFLLFETQEWPWIIFWTAVSFFGYLGLEVTGYQLIPFGELPKPDLPLLFRFNLFLSLVGEFLIMMVFVRVSRELENSFIDKAEEVNKSMIELSISKDKAEKAANARSLFLSSMSHEIRTPINSIIGFTNLLLEDNPSPEQRNYLSMIDFSSKNLLVIINDILEFNKMEAGKIIIEKIPFHFSNLIMNIYQSLKVKSDEKNLAFYYSIDPQIPVHFIGDPARLTQILFNLLSNAIKFTKTGDVRLEVKLQKIENEIATLLFIVTDTGIGIPLDKQITIFEQFTQVDSSTSRRFGGTGLGLSIVKKLIHLLDSSIFVESIVNQGSKFIFEIKFPLIQGSIPELIEKPQSIQSQDNSNYTILIVDDNELNLKVASQFIKKWGYKCLLSMSGEEALQLIKTNSVSMVLMDLQMPGWDGFEATEKIRAEGFTLPILALTADVVEEVSGRATTSGFQAIIYKPFQPQDLLEKIKSNL